MPNCFASKKDYVHTWRFCYEKGNISVLAYNVESILAEKLETILSRSVLNTRMRDFYDVYLLLKIKKKEIDMQTVNKALFATLKKRGTANFLADYKKILLEVRKSEYMQNLWENYRKEYFYASKIDFNSICRSIVKLLSEL